MSQLAREHPDDPAMQSLAGQREHFADIADRDDGVRCGNHPDVGCSGCRDCLGPEAEAEKRDRQEAEAEAGAQIEEDLPELGKMPARQAGDGDDVPDEAA